MSACLNAASISNFIGTDNPRHLRVITEILRGPLGREQLDEIAGCSNGPALVYELRHRGLELPCNRISFIDRDGCLCHPGIYSLTDLDRKKINQWLRIERKVAK